MKMSGNGGNRLSMGLFSVLTSLILLATLIFVNLTAAKLPSQYTEKDISGTGLYSLTEQTKETVGQISEDIELYWIVQSGEENSELGVLLNRYSSLSHHIKVTKVDPIVNPGFAEQYTGDQVNNNSIIVAGNTKSRFIDYSKIFVRNYNYFSDSDAETVFDGENQITSAIDYINNGYMPKLYKLTGHGEKTLSSSLEEQISRENYQLEKLDLVGLDSVPDDADCVIIAGPAKDITEKEAECLSDYIKKGGRLLVYTDYEHTELPKLMSLLDGYGIEVEPGLILEANQYMCYGNYPMQLLPVIGYHDITMPLVKGGYSVLVPMGHGLKIPENSHSGTTVTGLLQTSTDSYAKEGKISSVSKAAGDPEGPFCLGAAIEDSGSKAKIVWYTSSDLLNKDFDELVNGSNSDLMLNSLGWLSGKDSSIAIHSKKISGNKLTVPSGAAGHLGILLIGIIPLAYLAVGAVISMRRRKR